MIAGPSARSSSRRGAHGVTAHRLPGAEYLEPHRGSPVRVRLDDRDLLQDDVAKPVEQVVLVADMAVQGHGVDAERLAEASHAQAVEPAVVGKLNGRRENPVAGQRQTRRCGLGGIHAISILE